SLRMRTMASATAVRSFAGSCAQTCGPGTIGMAGPPCCGYSLEGRPQFPHPPRGQDPGVGGGVRGGDGAADRNVGDLIRGNLDLAMADVSWQIRQANQLQDPAIQGMARIGNSDLALAHLGDQRCITLAGACPSPGSPGSKRCRAGRSTR